MSRTVVRVARPRRERQAVFCFCLFLSLTVAYHVYSAYSDYFQRVHGQGEVSAQEYAQHQTTPLWPEHPFFAGRDHAPEQYRIGVVLPVAFLCDRLGIHKYYLGFTAVDACACLGCLLLLYATLCASDLMRSLDPRSQTLIVALLLAFMSMPLWWVTLYGRPETLVNACFLAAVLYLLTRLRDGRDRGLTIGGILLLTIWQGFTRADIAAVMGLAIALAWWLDSRQATLRARRDVIALGFTMTAIAVAVQIVLKRILYPDATYPPDTRVLQLLQNAELRLIIPFLIAVVPSVTVLLAGWRFRRQLDILDRTALSAAALYLPLFVSVAVLIELRVYVPFLLLLTPTLAKLSFLFLNEGSEQPPTGIAARPSSRLAPVSHPVSQA